ncbi:OmpA family protein [Antribacter sp. KLBMP9083]|uniref:OmpA family protein n=1 Tax=Antribacter soli TaxID=2910976 RepID=A0AA41UAC5_9MICO|nr:OmpA family protein [Antribacter soli]MCF4119999.1 OmpA family protein [Antribacter soli]
MRPTVPALVMALALTLAACTPAASGGPTPEPGPGTPVASPSAGPGPEDVVATTAIVAGGGELTVEVHPVVRAGEHAILTLDLLPGTPEGEDLAVDDLFETEIGVHTTAGGGLRLVDLPADTVYTVALDAGGDAVTTLDESPTIPAAGLRVRSAYAAPPADQDSLGLLLPGAYLPEVPVIEGEATAGALRPASGTEDTGDGEATLDLDAVAEAPVVALDSYTRELDGAVSTLTTTEQVQVTLGADVLFAVDSAELTPEAVAAVDAAAAHLAGRAPGTIDVVGHTDDIADDDHNLDLSERRAQAVAAALTERIDTGAYPIRTEGRGESEPLVPNDGDANRALNRRVTLTLTSEVVTETTVQAEGELPPFGAGPVGAGPEGVEVTSNRPYRVAAPRATRVDGHLVVEVQVTALDEAVDDEDGVAFLNGLWSYRGRDADSPRDAMSLVLLSGSTAVYPLDYLAGETAGGRPTWFPLGEADTLRRIDGGQTLTFTAIYPDVEGAESVTLQLGEATGTMPLRLTDVPVEG